MWREHAIQQAEKVLRHLFAHDRQHPEFLASAARVDLNSPDYNDVIAALGRACREQEIPLTYAPDLNIWTIKPLAGDAMANAIWDLRNSRTRLHNCAIDSGIAGKALATPAVRVVMAHIQGTADSVVAALDSQIEILRVALEKQREIERDKGLI